MLQPISRTFLVQLLLFCLALLPAYPQTTPQSLLILNAQVADGTGVPLYRANVRIAGSRIVEIGKLAPKPGEATLDAKGLVLAPGFIDIHNHSEESLPKDLAAETQVSQGITTLIIGADGESPWPLASWFHQMRDHPAAVNVGSFAGHATIRLQAMGKDFKRTSTPAEVRLMEESIRREMNEGALGLSSGLEYEVGSYAATDELVALAKIAAASGGVYMTHIRDEADKSFEALKEEIAIGERAHIPVEHSHIKLGTVGVQGKAPEYIKIIEAARKRGVDFLADCYPYDAWHSNLKVVVPDKQYENPKSVAVALESYGGGSHITITEFSPDKSYAGHTIAELAKSNGLSETDMYIRLIREGDAAHTEASIIGQSMIESDMKAFYQRRWVMVASDGGVNSQHPRGAGTFSRVLGLYVREKQWLTLPEAVRKMTSLPAQRLGWKDRGILRKGAVADLVLFDPSTVSDRSTFTDPTALSTGIEKVFVNGVLVWDSGKQTGARPGLVIGRKGAVLGVAN